MKRRQFLLVCLGASLCASGAARAAGPVKVVYHMADGIDQASRGLASIRNHLRAAPDTKIVVVALGEGIRFLLKGATERNGRPFEPAVAALARQGVEFRVCNNTLTAWSRSPGCRGRKATPTSVPDAAGAGRQAPC
jgi:intracellular sulfur oxidation DsrE/DsrF family protein